MEAAMVSNNNPKADLSFRIYEGTIPNEIYEKLDDIYQSVYSVRDYFYTYESFDNINAVVVSRARVPVHVIIFTIKKKRVQILNRLCSIDSKYIDYVSKVIFNKYESIVRIDFRGIYKTRFSNMNMPHLISSIYKDIVLDLPGNFELYYTKLGKKIRKNIKYYSRRLDDTFTNVKFEVRIGSNIDPNIVKQIITFNRLRMIQKGLRPSIDKNYEEKICAFSKLYGNVGVVRINGNVCAGTIFYRVGKHVYLHVLSHVINYDKYDLGIICLFHTIKYCIEIKAQTFHFLWGTSEYKHRFLGNDKEVCNIAIFRNNMHKMLNYYEIFPYIRSYLENLLSDSKLRSNKSARACYRRLMQIKNRLIK